MDEEHVKSMIKELRNLNSDILQQYPYYISRITSDAGAIGKGHLYQFKDIENQDHVIAVTSKLLTTGVDIPTCKNVILARVIRSMTDFKQIIGRGTRVKEEYGKISFNIVDYTNSTVLFNDPDFDGEPALIITSEIDDQGEVVETQEEDFTEDEAEEREDEQENNTDGFWGLPDDEDSLPRKFYVDGGREEIVEEQTYDLGGEMELRLSQLIDYTREQVRVLYRSQIEIQEKWVNPEERSQVIELLEDKGIDFDQLKEITGKTDADPFDLLCHLAFDAPVLTYKQRAELMKKKYKSFFEQ